MATDKTGIVARSHDVVTTGAIIDVCQWQSITDDDANFLKLEKPDFDHETREMTITIVVRFITEEERERKSRQQRPGNDPHE